MSNGSNHSITTKLITITPAEATALLESMLSNRRLNDRRVAAIASDISAGRWIENGETIKISTKGNLLDGQHRLAAVVKAGKHIKTLVVSGLPEKVMASIDQGRSRSNSDALGFLGVNNSTTASAMCRLIWEFEAFGVIGARVTAPRSLIVKTYMERAEKIQDSILCGSRCQRSFKVVRSTLGFVHFEIARKSKRVDEFFGAVADLESKNVPVNALRRFTDRTQRNRGHLRAERIVPIIFKAWNAWVKGLKPEVLMYRVGESFPELEA